MTGEQAFLLLEEQWFAARNAPRVSCCSSSASLERELCNRDGAKKALDLEFL